MIKDDLKNNSKAKKIFRVIGIICSSIGGFISLIGVIGIIVASSSLLLFNFIGIPLLFIGLVNLLIGFHKISLIEVNIEKNNETSENLIICNECNCVNDFDAIFCKKCGNKL